MMTWVSATQTLKILWIRGATRWAVQRAAQTFYQAECGAVGARLTGHLFQRFSDKLGFGQFRLPRHLFQARVKFLGYAANQRCHAVSLAHSAMNAIFLSVSRSPFPDFHSGAKG